MGGAVPPLPQYAFMAWCSVRGSTETTLPFYLYKWVKSAAFDNPFTLVVHEINAIESNKSIEW
jgi:hypothetical protein